ncbi:hypothetical protein J7W08_07645 [Methanococcoides orientis]|uniref:DUF7507 domain-containing protein n=1 Tax=Methanococcoides orientis TaxID=2822137 RepID=UPI001E5E27A9|nr:hypothetical protein [Methanococcoides orientis]UGV39987.1 hypothetical protein J7W08_07645 [Methanococcoides orientis]
MSGLTSISTNSPGLAPDPTDDRHESKYSEWEGAFVVSKDGGISMKRSSGGSGGSTVGTGPKNNPILTESASLSIVKLTNGADVSSPHDLEIPVGDPVTWSYNVSNTGDVSLTNILVNDSVEGPVGIIAFLGVGEYNDSLSLTGTSVAGAYQNNVNASTTFADVEVNATDISYYFGVSEPLESSAGLSIVKLTNGADVSSPHDLEIPVGDPVIWSYNVSNTGDVSLTNILVNDSVEGPVGTIAFLDVGEYNDSLSLTGTSVAGAYQNNVTASTTFADVEVNATDISYYFGVSEPLGSSAGLSIVKLTNGADVSSPHDLEIPVGDPVTWSYNVSNTGDVSLTNILVNDSVEGPVGTIAFLDVGEYNDSLSLTGTSVAGAYQNNVTASTTYADVEVNATDISYYFGVSEPLGSSAGLSIVKLTNGADVSSPHDLEIPVGDPVTWSYNVSNTGDVSLTNILVNDSVEGPVGTIAFLDVGEYNDSLSLTGTSVAGAYQNNVTASTTYADVEVNATDISYYFGVSEPLESSAGLSIVKLTNGADVSSPHDLEIPVGDPVIWSYNVSNTGDVALTNILVNDSVEGPVGTIAFLGVGEYNDSLSLTGISVAGAYQNNVNASTTYADVEVNATDISYYFGVNASIDIEKFTDGHDVDEPIGPYLLFGYPVEWTYNVTNTGNVNLTIQEVLDNRTSVSEYPINVDDNGIFEPGEVWVYNASGEVILGQYCNIGNVTASYGEFIAMDEDLSYYFGIDHSEYDVMVEGLGYWKKETNWDNWSIEEVTVGDVTYSKSAAIVNMSGNGDKNEPHTYTMFRHLVTAKLNVLIGVPYYPYDDNGTPVYFIEEADEWMVLYPLDTNNSVVGGAWDHNTSSQISGNQLKNWLEMYNEGELYID